MKKNKKILIFGSSGHAKAITEILEEQNYEIVGYLDSFAPAGSKVLSYKILGNEYLLANANKNFKTDKVVIAVGENSDRFKVFQKLRKINKNLKYPPVVANSAKVSKSAALGEGAVIMNNVLVNTAGDIGKFVVLNTAAIVEHNCIIGDFSSLATGVLLGGNVRVGQEAFIGLGARIIQNKKIGEGSVIGAGATVLTDIPDKVLAIGTPAKIKKINYSNYKIFSK
ncbi:MAG: acetyltransferase [Patescibacteria group bacterium]|nr:acetyltransferase [Patescibacteria group bacterium]